MLPAIDYKEEVFNSYTVAKDSSLGTVYVTIIENEKNEPMEVIISIGKSGTELRAWNTAISVLISELLKTHNINKVIELLSGISSDNFRIIKGIPVSSAIDAINMALFEYRKIKFNQFLKKYENEVDDTRRAGQRWKDNPDSR